MRRKCHAREYFAGVRTRVEDVNESISFERSHPVHGPNGAFSVVRTVRPLTQISLASARCLFDSTQKESPASGASRLSATLKEGQQAERASLEEIEGHESRNRRILFSAIDIARARARIKLSRDSRLASELTCVCVCVYVCVCVCVCQSAEATRLSG